MGSAVHFNWLSEMPLNSPYALYLLLWVNLNASTVALPPGHIRGFRTHQWIAFATYCKSFMYSRAIFARPEPINKLLLFTPGRHLVLLIAQSIFMFVSLTPLSFSHHCVSNMWFHVFLTGVIEIYKPGALPVLIEIRCAIKRPPITARPVHRACPRVPPKMTPVTFWNGTRTSQCRHHHAHPNTNVVWQQ